MSKQPRQDGEVESVLNGAFLRGFGFSVLPAKQLYFARILKRNLIFVLNASIIFICLQPTEFVKCWMMGVLRSGIRTLLPATL